MGEERIESLIDGGEASAAPPLGPALGPLGVNIGEVISSINTKTEDFKGMKVPVTVIVDTDTKEFEIEVGTPPAAQLILEEAEVESGSGMPADRHVSNLLIEQIIKVAKMKSDSLLGKNLKSKVKEVIGTCNSMGIEVEGKLASEVVGMVDDGEFDKEISSEKTELSEEDKEKLKKQREKLQEELRQKRKAEEERAENIMEEMADAELSEIKKVMQEEGISDAIMTKVLPTAEAEPEAEEYGYEGGES